MQNFDFKKNCFSLKICLKKRKSSSREFIESSKTLKVIYEKKNLGLTERQQSLNNFINILGNCLQNVARYLVILSIHCTRKNQRVYQYFQKTVWVQSWVDKHRTFRNKFSSVTINTLTNFFIYCLKSSKLTRQPLVEFREKWIHLCTQLTFISNALKKLKTIQKWIRWNVYPYMTECKFRREIINERNERVIYDAGKWSLCANFVEILWEKFCCLSHTPSKTASRPNLQEFFFIFI